MMLTGNIIIQWIVYIILAWLYGALVQYVLGYERSSLVLTISIGAIGILVGKYILPSFFNIHGIFHIAGVPLIASLIGSFIIPGAMWLLRKDEIFSKRGGKSKYSNDE